MQDLSFTFPRVSVFTPHRYVSRVFTPSVGPALPISQICIYSDLCIDFISNLDNTIKDLLRFQREYMHVLVASSKHFLISRNIHFDLPIFYCTSLKSL